MRLAPRSAHRPVFKRSLLAVGLATALALGTLAAATPALAAGPTQCPAAFPTKNAVDGVTGTGYTVERGTVPDPFTATILGRITDGIAPGVDMIMADLDSPALDRAGGVWQGMSGSPVYAGNGKLIGSVSYGLSFGPSKIAGLTPAASMKPILTQLAATTTRAQSSAVMRERVSATTSAASRVAATGDATSAQAAGGFQQLAVPLWVSGTETAGNHALFDRLQQRLPGARVLAGGATAGGASAPASSISAGGNFASAISYGVATLAAIGTTTFVCNGTAVAFGHPFLSAGSVSMSAHPATAVYVQPDSAGAPFKVANLGGVAGTVDRDTLTGIRAQLGVTPPTTLITSHLTSSTGGGFNGTTHAVYPNYTADAAAFHTLFSIQKALGYDGVGSADVTITVKGVRASGKAFTVRIADSYADQYSIGFAVADQMFFLIDSLENQPFEEVHLKHISVNGSVSPTYNAELITGVKVLQGTKYVKPPEPIAAAPKKDLALRLTLTPYRSTASTTVDAALAVPAGTRGQFGFLTIEAGQAEFPLGDPSSFPQLLNAWRHKAMNASIEITLYLDTATVRTVVPTSGPVGFFDGFYDVIVE